MSYAGRTEAERLAASAAPTRAGYQLAAEWPEYAAVVRARLGEVDAAPLSDADRVWVSLHAEGGQGPEAEALRRWLRSDAPPEALDAELGTDARANARELLSSHPYADVYVWSLRRMFPGLSGTAPVSPARGTSATRS